ncbi:hypothetical protein ACYX7E_08310 [Luteimonas sp. RIT-PG2_3]
MSLTIGLTGMDPATESALRALLAEANARLDGQWQLLPEAEAEHVLVDMDSMYGPMSWLRLHAAGKQVVGLTSAPRTLTPYRLARPFDVDSVVATLRDIAANAGAQPGDHARNAAQDPGTSATGTAPATLPEVSAAATAGPALSALATQATQMADTAAIADVATPATAAKLDTAPAPPLAGAASPPPAGKHQHSSPDTSPAATAPGQRSLLAWLSPGALVGQRRLARSSGPTLLIDADARTYHGPATLKPLAQYFDGTLPADALAATDPDQWQREAAAAGAAQPLSRLVWLGALLAGNGTLLPPLEADGRYRLHKWPQTEREFPKHFRIATAMMKGPASVAEIAEASGIAAPDVADFINANLATGYAEAVRDAAPVAAEPARTGGLLGRLRKR